MSCHQPTSPKSGSSAGFVECFSGTHCGLCIPPRFPVSGGSFQSVLQPLGGTKQEGVSPASASRGFPGGTLLPGIMLPSYFSHWKSQRLTELPLSCSCVLLPATSSGHTKQGGAWEEKEERQGVRKEERPVSEEIQRLLHPRGMQVPEGAPSTLLHVSVPCPRLALLGTLTLSHVAGCSLLSLFLELITISPGFFITSERKSGGGKIFLVSGRAPSPPPKRMQFPVVWVCDAVFNPWGCFLLAQK